MLRGARMIPDAEFMAMKAWFSSGSTMSESMGLRLIREVEELRDTAEKRLEVIEMDAKGMRELADEVKELRAALWDIVIQWDDGDITYFYLKKAIDRARAALGEERMTDRITDASEIEALRAALREIDAVAAPHDDEEQDRLAIKIRAIARAALLNARNNTAMSDILEELDRWLAEWRGVGDFRHPRLPQLERIRDEIAALRLKLADKRLLRGVRIRNEALEEAARACDRKADGPCNGYKQAAYEESAAAIRALKEKP